MSKPKLFPAYGAGRYNDVAINCPYCHNPIIIFEGCDNYHICYKCGGKIKDRKAKENNAAYKQLKTELKGKE